MVNKKPIIVESSSDSSESEYNRGKVRKSKTRFEIELAKHLLKKVQSKKNELMQNELKMIEIS